MKSECEICGSASLRRLGERIYKMPLRDGGHFEFIQTDTICESCGFLFNTTPPPDDKLKYYYERNRRYACNYYYGNRLRMIKKMCGTIKYSVPAVKDIGSDSDFQDLLRDRGYRSDAERFDIITLYYVLEHISGIRDFAKGIIAELKPTGHLIVEVPDFARCPIESLYPEHLCHFTPFHLRIFCESLGLELIETEVAHSRNFGFCSAFRLKTNPVNMEEIYTTFEDNYGH